MMWGTYESKEAKILKSKFSIMDALDEDYSKEEEENHLTYDDDWEIY